MRSHSHISASLGGSPKFRHLMIKNESFKDVWLSYTNKINTKLNFLFEYTKPNICFSPECFETFNLPSVKIGVNEIRIFPNLTLDFMRFYFFDSEGNLVDPESNNIYLKEVFTRHAFNEKTKNIYLEKVLQWNLVQKRILPLSSRRNLNRFLTHGGLL